ncbi:MAG TPA: 23S rRNA (pseudouridine(1915)-N(3))-methyltransferase RlmH, partial [Candidatus Cloacimonadota bacterium]|nr:23S rRNA (pseudouridine(1915)-N(3))-methyltransferase RlmH [Candidatus Cloacimonadota bacterium]
MNIKIICIAKTKEKYFIEPFLEYQKRLLPYANVELKELAASKLTSTNNIDIVKKEEKQRILKALSPNLPIIVLSEEGMQINSVDFAHKIHTWQIKGGAQF